MAPLRGSECLVKGKLELAALLRTALVKSHALFLCSVCGQARKSACHVCAQQACLRRWRNGCCGSSLCGTPPGLAWRRPFASSPSGACAACASSRVFPWPLSALPRGCLCRCSGGKRSAAYHARHTRTAESSTSSRPVRMCTAVRRQPAMLNTVARGHWRATLVAWRATCILPHRCDFFMLAKTRSGWAGETGTLLSYGASHPKESVLQEQHQALHAAPSAGAQVPQGELQMQASLADRTGLT